MSKTIKVLSVFGTRPEAIKMAPVVIELERHFGIENRICVTAQHREMLDQVLGLFKIVPDYDLDLMKERQTLAELTSRVVREVAKVLEKERPDIILVQGDTTTTFAAALAAFYLKVPVGHVEAGLRTNNRYSPFPEEVNRRITSVVTDLHFVPTEKAKHNLLSEGYKESTIYVTGNTVIDAFLTVIRNQQSEDKKVKMERYFREVWNIELPDGGENSGVRLILVTGHRRESFGEGFKRICEALRSLAANNSDIEIVYPVHLNPNVRGPVYSILGEVENIHLIDPLDYEPFVFLMSRSYLILTDSGGIQEEAPSLGVPVLVMRDTSERPEGIEAGSAKLVGTDVETIILETQRLLENKDIYRRMAEVKNPYGDGKASKRIVEIITDFLEG